MSKIRILHIIPSIGKGGAERVAVNICNELTKRKDVEVKLVYFYPGNEYKNITDENLTQFINSKITLSVLGKHNEQLEEFDKLVKEFKPTIIHSHLYEAEILCRYKIIKGCSYFSHLHSHRKQFLKPVFSDFFIKERLVQLYERRFLIKRYLECKNHFIAVSDEIEGYYKNNLPKYLHTIKLLYNPIDYNRFLYDEARVINPPLIKLISVGSLRKLKNHTYLIDVVKYLKDRDYEVQLLILGEGKERASIETKIKEYGLSKEIKLLGNDSHPENYLKQADIYVHSSISESFGLAILEAMAAGLPCVCLDAKGNRSIVKNGYNGYLLKDHRIDDFCEKIERLIKHPDLYTKISKHAIEFSKDFDIGAYVENLMLYYKQILSKKELL